MFSQFRALSFHIIVAVLVFSSLGIVYAAWNDDVSNSDTLTADRWNDLVTQVEGIGGGSGKFINGTDTNDAVYTTGNVGIGTNSPSSHLEISGSGTQDVRVTSSGGAEYAGLLLNANSRLWSIRNRTDLSGGFSIADETAGTHRFVISNSGDVGMGTSSPSAKLDVVGNIESDSLQLLNGGSAATPVLTMNGDSDTGLYTPGANSVGVTTNGAARMVFDASGNVGIGTASPSFKLDVKNVGGDAVNIDGGNDFSGLRLTSDSGAWSLRTSVSDNFIIYDTDNTNQVVTIERGGLVGIGTTNPERLLDVAGDIKMYQPGGNAFITGHNSSNTETLRLSTNGNSFFNGGNLGVNTNPSYTLEVNGTVAGVGAYVNLSDARFKENINAIHSPMAKIEALRGVTYTWKDPVDTYSEGLKYGLIAQEVEAVLPEAVTTAENEKGTKAVDYNAIIPLLIEGMKAQQQQIEELQTQLDNQ